MKQISRRKKGRRLQNYLRSKIMQTFPILRPEDVRVAKNGENGADIKLSKVAKCLVPYSFETKNQEKMKTIYDWLDQADRNSGKLEAVLVIKQNTRRPLVVIDMETFFELIRH